MKNRGYGDKDLIELNETNQDMPLVEILLPTYNGEKFLKEQLNSIVNQSYKNWTLTIRDDGSTDNTKNILSEYNSLYPSKINLIDSTERTKSAKGSFFKLLKLATADYIMFCDQDDVWEKDKIELSLQALLKIECRAPSLVFTDLTVVDERLNIINSSFKEMSKLNCSDSSLNKLLVQNTVTGCAAIMNKSLADIAKQAVNIENISMHDSWVAICAKTFGNISYLPKSTIKYRQHGSNSVGAKSVLSFSYLCDKLININKIKIDFDVMVRQAGEFLSCYSHMLNDSQKKMLTDFSSFNSYSKINRIKTLHKYKLYKNGIARIIAQWVLL